MKCPKCNGAMQSVSVDEFTVDRCGKCEGIWFDLRELDHLREIKGSEDRIDTASSARGKSTDAIRDISCPQCGVKLVKLAFPDQPHVHYEQCGTCGGAFLDCGEFADLKKLTFAERVKKLLRPLRH